MTLIQTAKVSGGEISFTIFGPANAEHVIFAPHGITANMLTWTELSKALTSVRIVAPDLRGRGRSNNLNSPFGLKQHAVDGIAIMDQLEVEQYHIVGHSMGGFVSVPMAAMDPERVQSVTLVDGGLPLLRPAGVSDSDLVRATLGPAAQRLAMVFSSEASYLEFWRDHPAFRGGWSDSVESYLKHDLEAKPEGLRPRAQIQAVATDILELFGSEEYFGDMSAIQAPISFIRAPRGLLNEEPLYGQDLSVYATSRLSDFHSLEADGVNHYTILLSAAGATQVAKVIEARLASLGKVKGF